MDSAVGAKARRTPYRGTAALENPTRRGKLSFLKPTSRWPSFITPDLHRETPMSKLPIALQLYTVRDQMEKDVPGTLKAVADMGYENVECAGTAGLSPEDYRKACEAAGLTIVSAHVPAPTGECVCETIEMAIALGVKYVATGMPGPLREQGAEGYRTHAQNCQEAALKFAKQGITFCYHNHSFEFAQFDGKYGLDILYEESSPDSLQAQFDVYWVQHGGEDPAQYMLKWKDRCKTIHLKDMLDDEAKSFAEVGQGILNWPRVFEAAAEIGVDYYIVEQDRCAGPSLESAKISIENLKSWGYA